MSDSWESLLHASEIAYEDFFPEISERYNQSDHHHSPYHTILSKHNLSILNKSYYQPSNSYTMDSQRRYSDTSMKYLQTLETLEEKFVNMVDTVYDLQQRSLDINCNRDKVGRLQGELAQIAGDLDKFQFEKVDAVISANATSGQDIVRARRKSLNRRCNALRDEIEANDDLVRDMVEYGDGDGGNDSTECADSNVPILDEIQPDWSDMIVLQKRASMSAVCKRFCTSVEQAQVPLCDAVFEYLLSPAGHAYSLEICGYSFAPAELRNILHFLSSRNKLRTEIQSLVLFDCGLTDDDCAVIGEFLANFTSLQTFSLRKNNITSDGFAEIAKAIVANEMKLRALHIDRNAIDAIGMVELSLVFKSCPLLSSCSFSYNPIGDIGLYFFLRGILNPYRNAFHTLPIPPDPEGLIPRIISVYNLRLAENNSPLEKTSESSSDMQSQQDDITLPSHSRDESINGYQEEKSNDSEEQRSVGDAEFRMGFNGTTELNDRDADHSFDEKESSGVNLSQRIARMRVKLAALMAFKTVSCRGHILYALRAEGCELSPFSTLMVAHTLRDNTYVTDVFLSNNIALMTTPDACVCIAELLQLNNIRVLELKNTGIEDSNARTLSQGLSKSTSVQAVELSYNPMGSTAATWVASATGDLFFDHFSISTIPSKSYAVDIL